KELRDSLCFVALLISDQQRNEILTQFLNLVKRLVILLFSAGCFRIHNQALASSTEPASSRCASRFVSLLFLFSGACYSRTSFSGSASTF
ncbi:MAG TPA: hypothetical protein VF457_18140, partial [Burkholderiaceae bacterium]